MFKSPHSKDPLCQVNFVVATPWHFQRQPPRPLLLFAINAHLTLRPGHTNAFVCLCQGFDLRLKSGAIWTFQALNQVVCTRKCPQGMQTTVARGHDKSSNGRIPVCLETGKYEGNRSDFLFYAATRDMHLLGTSSSPSTLTLLATSTLTPHRNDNWLLPQVHGTEKMCDVVSFWCVVFMFHA